MESTHQIHSATDAHDYITRMQKVRAKFAGVKEGLIRREQAGVIPRALWCKKSWMKCGPS
jgi:hypothetical protein